MNMDFEQKNNGYGEQDYTIRFGEEKDKANDELIDNIKQQVQADDRRLRVYVDEKANKYYIDVFAAYSLGFISYGEACVQDDCGTLYFEISQSTLSKLQEILKDRIYYFAISLSDEQDYSKNVDSQYNHYNKDIDFESNNFKFEMSFDGQHDYYGVIESKDYYNSKDLENYSKERGL